MTKSSTSPTTDVPESQPRRSSWNWGRALLVLIFRLLLLGVSGSLAALLGIAIAQLYPGKITEPPLAEKLLQGSQALTDNFKQVTQSQSSPGTAPGGDSGAAPTDATPSNPAPITTLPPAVPSAQSASPSLSDADRQQAQTELTQLQGELQKLNDRATALAGRVGGAGATTSLEEQLQTIQHQLDPNAPAPTVSSTQPQNQSVLAPTTSTLAENGQLMVTLPSDALFVENQTTLRPETSVLLDTIVTDLRNYPGATIQVAGHTDSQGA
ncbi:MAG TPA: hypothetical protein V6C65_39155, partial [Allocoleopsis sp.]